MSRQKRHEHDPARVQVRINDQQLTACKKHAAAARWAYNWALARKQEVYRATGTSPSAMELRRDLNALTQTQVPWMYEVSKCAPQEALRNPDTAFAHFFRRAKLKQQGKTRRYGLGSSRLNGSIMVFSNAIQLPRLGRLRRNEFGSLPTSGARVLSATISEQSGRWHISVLVE